MPQPGDCDASLRWSAFCSWRRVFFFHPFRLNPGSPPWKTCIPQKTPLELLLSAPQLSCGCSRPPTPSPCSRQWLRTQPQAFQDLSHAFSTIRLPSPHSIVSPYLVNIYWRSIICTKDSRPQGKGYSGRYDEKMIKIASSQKFRYWSIIFQNELPRELTGVALRKGSRVNIKHWFKHR